MSARPRTLTPDELLLHFPHASKSTVAANLPAGSARPTAEPECAAGDPVAPAAGDQKEDRPRFHVRITSVRRRLLDEDNLVGTFHCDLLRYAGVIPDDAPHLCRIETTQRKAAKGEEEHVVIEVFSAVKRSGKQEEGATRKLNDSLQRVGRRRRAVWRDAKGRATHTGSTLAKTYHAENGDVWDVSGDVGTFKRIAADGSPATETRKPGSLK